MSIPEKEKEASAPPTKTEEEEDGQDEGELLAGVSSEVCRPTEQSEKEDESEDTTKLTQDEERDSLQQIFLVTEEQYKGGPKKNSYPQM